MLRHIEVYSGIIEAHGAIIKTMCNPCIYNRALFRILAYLELKASSKVFQAYKIIMHIQSPNTVRTVFQEFLRIFRHIQGY